MNLYWPSLLCPSSSRIEIIDNTGKFSSSLNGFARTVSRPGSRIRLTMNVQNLKDQKRAVMQAVTAALRGSDRIYSKDYSLVRRGGFLGGEKLENNTFEDGIGTWTSGSEYTLSESDRVLRATRNAVTATANLLLSPTLTVTPYRPYAARAVIIQGQGAFGNGFTPFGSTDSTPVAGAFGLITNAHVPLTSTLQFRIRDEQASAISVGEFVSIPFVSYAPCVLVDNGPNMLRHTQDMSENPSFWTLSNATLGDDVAVAPDGTTSSDSLIENTANSTHYTQGVAVSAAAVGEYSFSVALNASSRTWARIHLIATNPSTSSVTTYVNLTTGALGTPSTGASWSDARFFSTSLGNGWWQVSIVAKKTTADIQLTARIATASADTTDSYTGTTSRIFMWRPTLAQSSLPTRLTNNAGTANDDGDSQNLAGGIYTKGWTASTNNLLLPGDQIQIGDQLLIVTSKVDSDAAGRAFLQFAPSLRLAPTDNAPVIITHPMGKFMLEPNESGWTNVPGIFSDSEITLVESA